MKNIVSAALALVLAACGAAEVTSSSASSAGATQADAAASTLRLTWKGMETPESVLYDAPRDRYLVSNIKGAPLADDDNGFISELSPDGTVKNLTFIQGGKQARLSAPKGMAITRDVLYVADIDHVRTFDAVSGAPKGDIFIPGASFLNDVTAAPDGRVWVTDSGLKQGASGFEPTGTDAVWLIERNEPRLVVKSPKLERPNGIHWNGKDLLVNTFGTNEVFRLDAKGSKVDVTKTPEGSLDGLVPAGDALLVSSWAGNAIYRGTLGGTFEPVVKNVSAAADIAYDAKRHRVLVPRFSDNVVEAYDLNGASQ